METYPDNQPYIGGSTSTDTRGDAHEQEVTHLFRVVKKEYEPNKESVNQANAIVGRHHATTARKDDSISLDDGNILRRRRLLRAHVSPLRQLLQSQKHRMRLASIGIPPASRIPPDLPLTPNSEAEALLVASFAANLRHIYGTESSKSAWSGLTMLQGEQFGVIHQLLDCMPILVRAVMAEDPAAQRVVLQLIEQKLKFMEGLAAIEEDAWQEVRES